MCPHCVAQAAFLVVPTVAALVAFVRVTRTKPVSK